MLEQAPNYDVSFVSANSLTSKDYDAATQIVDHLIETGILNDPLKINVSHMLSFNPFMSGLNSFVFTHNSVRYLAIPSMHRTGAGHNSFSVSVSVEAVN